MKGTPEEEYFERLRFEHELINRRVTWLLTSQTILLSAFGLVLKTENATQPTGEVPDFLKVMAIAGAVITSLILVGIVAGVVAKYSVWKDYQVHDPNAEWGARTWVTVVALLPDITLPIVFIVAWVWGYQYYAHEHFPFWYGLPGALGLFCLGVGFICDSRIRKRKHKRDHAV
jgi:hypothetical protein